MNARLVVVGKADPELLAYEMRLRKKARGFVHIEVVELAPSRARTPDARRKEEAKRLAKALGRRFVALDPGGKLMDSEAWAQALVRFGRRIELVIGGADGVHALLRAQATECWSLSPLVFSHQLARAIVIEQLFRAAAILAGHPYHRSA